MSGELQRMVRRARTPLSTVAPAAPAPFAPRSGSSDPDSGDSLPRHATGSADRFSGQAVPSLRSYGLNSETFGPAQPPQLPRRPEPRAPRSVDVEPSGPDQWRATAFTPAATAATEPPFRPAPTVGRQPSSRAEVVSERWFAAEHRPEPAPADATVGAASRGPLEPHADATARLGGQPPPRPGAVNGPASLDPAPAAAPDVTISIGHIEVHAPTPERPATRPRFQPRVSLDEFLDSRGGR